MDWVEFVGYLASAFIVAGLLQTRILWLRLCSLGGAIVFSTYAILIEAVPLLVTNLILIAINVWQIWRILSGREEFTLLEVPHDSPYLQRFLEFHSDDISEAQPDFSGVREGDTIVMVLRDMVPTVLVVGRPRGNAFRVFLDYAIPRYRDFKGGQWLFEERADFFHRFDVDEVVATGLTPMQTRYLKRADFRPREDGKWARPVGR